jgi:hypothetical protein
MKINYFKESYMEQLKTNISNNRELYKQDDVWVTTYFGHDNFYLPSNLDVNDIVLLNEESEIENVKILYKALQILTPTQASDERLWAYLAHVNFWDYMRFRWPANKENADVLGRYFFGSSKAPVRNGIARLWWYGYLSYDDSRENPFELTEMLVKRQDFAQNLLERSFGRNRTLTKAILSVLLEMEREGKPLLREKYRGLLIHINRMGGVTVLDALDKEDIEKVVKSKLFI